MARLNKQDLTAMLNTVDTQIEDIKNKINDLQNSLSAQ